MLNKISDFLSRRKFARDVALIHEIVQTTAVTLGGQPALGSHLIEKTASIYSNTENFRSFLLQLIEADEFPRAASVAYPAAQHFVKFIYKHVLLREPETPSLHAFAQAIANREMSYEDVALEILNSQEAKSLGESQRKLTYLEIIDSLNQNIFKKKISDTEIEKIGTELATGKRNIHDVLNSIDETIRFIATSEDLPALIQFAYQACFDRFPADEEIDIWKTHILSGNVSTIEFLRLLADSEETRNYRNRMNNVSAHLSDGEFVQMVYEAQLERGASGPEIATWCTQLAAHHTNRMQMLSEMFNEFVLDNSVRELPQNDPFEIHLMGTNKKVTAAAWKAELAKLAKKKVREEHSDKYSRFSFNISRKKVLVSAIASLYKGGPYIEHFMENLTSQSIFKDYSELIIIDAHSPDNESTVIEKYARNFPNIKYKRYDYRVGIYEAWNIGVEASSGEFLTNTNLDDVRRSDSLERQAAALTALPFVDIVYQDFYYAFEKNVDYDLISLLGAKSNVGHVTPFSLFVSNPPHNAPMWRKSLHGELGLFDSTFKSAGDYEFWMRCLAAGKKFYKLNDPHATYFQNPTGLSTSRETPGISESKRITKKYGRKIIPTAFTCSSERFFDLANCNSEIMTALSPSERYNFLQGELRKAAIELKEKPRSE